MLFFKGTALNGKKSKNGIIIFLSFLLCAFIAFSVFGGRKVNAESAPPTEETSAASLSDDYVFDKSSGKFSDECIIFKLPKNFIMLEDQTSNMLADDFLRYFLFTNSESAESSVIYAVKHVDKESKALENIREQDLSEKVKNTFPNSEIELPNVPFQSFKTYGNATLRYECKLITPDNELNKIIMLIQNGDYLIELNYTFLDSESKTFQRSAESLSFPSDGKVEFILIDEFHDVTVTGWIMISSAIVILIILIIYIVLRQKGSQNPGKPKNTAIAAPKKVNATVVLVHGALCIAMSFVLSYFKLFSMPNSGSVTLASMLPLMVYSNRYGAKYGLTAGVVYGILQYIQKPEMFHWVQMLIDYPIAFGLIGLGGLVKGEKNLVFSVLIGGTARFLAHFASGVICFGKYVMIGANAAGLSFSTMLRPNVIASFGYNAPYMFADIAICAVIALLPPFRSAVKKALKY